MSNNFDFNTIKKVFEDNNYCTTLNIYDETLNYNKEEASQHFLNILQRTNNKKIQCSENTSDGTVHYDLSFSDAIKYNNIMFNTPKTFNWLIVSIAFDDVLDRVFEEVYGNSNTDYKSYNLIDTVEQYIENKSADINLTPTYYTYRKGTVVEFGYLFPIAVTNRTKGKTNNYEKFLASAEKLKQLLQVDVHFEYELYLNPIYKKELCRFTGHVYSINHFSQVKSRKVYTYTKKIKISKKNKNSSQAGAIKLKEYSKLKITDAIKLIVDEDILISYKIIDIKRASDKLQEYYKDKNKAYTKKISKETISLYMKDSEFDMDDIINKLQNTKFIRVKEKIQETMKYLVYENRNVELNLSPDNIIKVYDKLKLSGSIYQTSLLLTEADKVLIKKSETKILNKSNIELIEDAIEYIVINNSIEKVIKAFETINIRSSLFSNENIRKALATSPVVIKLQKVPEEIIEKFIEYNSDNKYGIDTLVEHVLKKKDRSDRDRIKESLLQILEKMTKKFKKYHKIPKISDQDIDTSTKGKYYFQLSSDSIEKNRDLIEKYQEKLEHYCVAFSEDKEIQNLYENKKFRT